MSSYSKLGVKSNVKTSKVVSPKVSASSSSGSSPNPLMARTKSNNYGKQKPTDASAFGAISFGQTGLTGRD